MSRNQWIRHRLRSMIWKQWKRGKARYAKLRQLGVRKDLAAQTAGSPLAARGDWRIVPPCILRCPLRTSTLLVFHDCLVLCRDPLNRRMRTRMSGGVAGCVKKMRKHHAVREIEGRPLGAVL